MWSNVEVHFPFLSFNLLHKYLTKFIFFPHKTKNKNIEIQTTFIYKFRYNILKMAEEFCGTTNWWDSTPTNSRFDGGGGGGRGGSSSTSSTTTVANNGGGPVFGWLTDGPTGVDTKMDSSSVQLVGLGLSSQPMVEWKQQPSALL